MKKITHTSNPVNRYDPKDITSNSRTKKKAAIKHNEKYAKAMLADFNQPAPKGA